MTTNIVTLDTPDTLAQQSLKHYVVMFDLLRSLSHHLEVHKTEDVERFNKTFSNLHKEAQVVDMKLMECLRESSIPDSIAIYLKQRKTLQEDILQLLKETLPKANSVKSLLASEMQAVSNGRKALNGYKNNTPHQGRIVNKKS